MSGEPDALWIHGWAASPRVWEPLWEYLGAVRPRQPVFDQVTTTSGLDRAVADCLRSPCLLIGWSLGGNLAIAAARRFPALVRGLILLSTNPCFTSTDPRLGWSLAHVERLRRRLRSNPESALRSFNRQMFTDTERAMGLVDAYESACPPTLQSWLNAGLQYLAGCDQRRELEHLQVPTLWIHGEADTVCPLPSLQTAMGGLATHANHRMVTLADAGHAPLWSNPERIGELIQEFVHECSPG